MAFEQWTTRQGHTKQEELLLAFFRDHRQELFGRPENPDQLLARIEEALRFVPADRLAISPQCGFATSIPGNLVTADEQWRKLEIVVVTARHAWGS